MSTAAGQSNYDLYARERIIQKIDELCRSHPGLTQGGIAALISRERGVEFHRIYMARLREGELSDPLIDVIVDWIVRNHDGDFREKLAPDSIFWQAGESNRDFYFHFSQMDSLEAWEEKVLRAFEGVYLCAPDTDLNTCLPSKMVRDFFERIEAGATVPEERRHRSLDIKQYIAERSFLILKATPEGYYHAAEFPYGLLFPPHFETLDLRMVYEGVGIASGNSIRVFLRECLSRVGKSHSILITPKGKNEADNPNGISLFTAGEIRQPARAAWSKLPDESLTHLREEFAAAIALDYSLKGTAQIEVSPLPNLKNRVDTTFSRDCVYHRKDADFLKHPEVHFIRPDIIRAEEVGRILNHPLSVGSLI